jgi:hypothetical protein
MMAIEPQEEETDNFFVGLRNACIVSAVLWGFIIVMGILIYKFTRFLS